MVNKDYQNYRHEYIELLKNLHNYLNNRKIRMMLDMYNEQRIERLKKEGKFIELYNTLNEKEYEQERSEMIKSEIKIDGINSLEVFKFKSKICLKIFKVLTLAILTSLYIKYGLFNDMLLISSSIIIENNKSCYSEDIDKYNRKIDEYASRIKELNLTSFQIVMKVINDMWSSIDGYGLPTEEILGFQRLVFLEDGGVGVCRNMADDVTAKLNAINPEFHARNMVVYMKDENYQLCNIKTKMSKASINNQESNDDYYTTVANNILKKELFGNHMVVLFDMPGENVTMVADPTNPSLGIYKDGRIYMFSYLNDECYFGPKEGQRVMGFNSVLSCNNTKIYSYFTSIDIDMMIEKYGIEAENKALDEIHNIEENIKVKKYDEMSK